MKLIVLFNETDNQEFEVINIPDRGENKDVIACSPIIKENATNAYRVVLRLTHKGDGRAEYVVHNQQFPTTGNKVSIAFSNGNYYSELPPAWAKFVERSARLLRIPAEAND